nr:dynamin family protein [Maliibacterium massiliense]
MNNDFAFSDRVVVHFADIKAALDDVLDDVHALRSDSLIRQILSEGDLQKIRQWESFMKKRASEPFSIVIMGDFKRGKSTLINALLGKDVAPMDVSPETITINRIAYGASSQREAVLANGKRVRLQAEELSRSELEAIIEKVPAPIDHIEMTEPIALLEQITIIDTPGLGDVLGAYDAQVKEYLNSADAVIYVVSALSPLSESEQRYLCEAILPQHFARLFVVVNMADCFESEEDVLRVKQEIVQRVAAFSENADVYAVSALDEFCRAMGYPRPNEALQAFLADAFAQLRGAIDTDIVARRDMLKAQRLVTLAGMMSKDIRGRIALVGSMLKLNREKLAQMGRRCEEENVNLHHTLAQYEETLRARAQELGYEAKGWISAFLARLRVEIEDARSHADGVDIQKHFQFYITDVVREAILCCIQAHRPALEQAIRQATQSFSQKAFFDNFRKEDFDIAVGIADVSWTDVDSVMFFLGDGLQLAGIRGVSFGVIGQAVAGFLRQNKVKKAQADLLKPVLESYGALEGEVYAQLDGAYQKMADKACEKVRDLFQSELAASREAIDQAMRISDGAQAEQQQVAQQMQNANKMLDHIDEVLANYAL